MKKVAAMLLAVLLMASVCPAFASEDYRYGVLATEVDYDQVFAHFLEEDATHKGETGEQVPFDNLTSMLMAVRSGSLNWFRIGLSTARYVCERNQDLMVSVSAMAEEYDYNFSMMTLDSKQDVCDILSQAIQEIKDDGTMDTLIEEQLYGFLEEDPTPAPLPVYEGARTIRIAVTGDLPPMDYVSADGKAAGFNVALISEIARRAQVNFELVVVEAAARPIALASDKVDAIFWTQSISCPDHGVVWAEIIPGTVTTPVYFTEETAMVHIKAGA